MAWWMKDSVLLHSWWSIWAGDTLTNVHIPVKAVSPSAPLHQQGTIRVGTRTLPECQLVRVTDPDWLIQCVTISVLLSLYDWNLVLQVAPEGGILISMSCLPD